VTHSNVTDELNTDLGPWESITTDDIERRRLEQKSDGVDVL